MLAERAWIATVAVLGVLLAVQTLRLSQEKESHATTRAEFAQAQARAQAEARALEAAYRAEELRRRKAQEEIVNEHETKLAQAQAAARAADSAAARLRERLAQVAAAARTSSPDRPAAATGAPAPAPADLYADVQRRLDEAVRTIARFADDAALAGATCERSYDALTVIDPALPDTHGDMVKLFWDPFEGADYLTFKRKRAKKG